MPISVAHTNVARKKKNPLSEYEMRLAEVDDQPNLVFACPYGCKQDQMDDRGHCDHLIGFTNTKLNDGEVKAVPEGATIEILSLDRDLLQRRLHTKKVEPLQVGDYLVRVNGTTRRVYRKPNTEVPASKDAAAGTDASSNKKKAPVG